MTALISFRTFEYDCAPLPPTRIFISGVIKILSLFNCSSSCESSRGYTMLNEIYFALVLLTADAISSAGRFGPR